MPSIDPRVDQIPKELQDSFEKRVYFEELERFLHAVWQNLEAGTAIPLITSEVNRKADTLLYAVLAKVSLGDPLTSDTTGFTVDSTKLTVGMTES
jgi:hypothetical protein